MDEKIIPIELNPKVVRKYHYSKPVYRFGIKDLGIYKLIISIILICAASLLSSLFPDRYFSLIFVLLVASALIAISFLIHFVKCCIWYIAIWSTTKTYKNLGNVSLRINENGIGILNEAGELFITWDKTKSFKIHLNFMFLYYSDKNYNLFPLANLETTDIEFVKKKLVDNGAIEITSEHD